MNAVTIQQTTQGLLRYLQQQEPERLRRHGIAIGYDGRHGSHEFAAIAAAVCVSQGIPAWLFSELVPTPFVPAAVQQLVSWPPPLLYAFCARQPLLLPLLLSYSTNASTAGLRGGGDGDGLPQSQAVQRLQSVLEQRLSDHPSP
jgi:hypothetical protein